MDFALGSDQEALRDLARQIFTDHVTHDRLKALEAAGEWYHAGAWEQLARANLLGVAIPEAHGGSDLSFAELCLLLEEVGRAVAPVPVLPTLVLGALPIARFGSEELRQRWLPRVAAGDCILTAALVDHDSADPLAPTTTAKRDGKAWRLDGIKTTVPAADRAERILVPARTARGTALFLLDPQAAGVKREAQILTNREPHALLTLSGARVEAADVVAAPDRSGAALRWLYEHALAAYCAVQVGVSDRAMRMTAEYTIGREQFGVSIASFQAVHTRAADAYIDLESMRLTTQEAVFRLSQGLPATESVTIAKFCAAECGQRVAVAAQHLHGGIGVDVDYPLHRHFLWAKHLELVLGSAPHHLARLAEMMAA